MKLLAASLFVAVLSLSCQRSMDEVSSIQTEPEFITVTATIADTNPASKVTLVNDGSVGKTKWVNGDEVFFHGAFVGTSGEDNYSYVAAAHNVSADGKTASFTIPIIAKRFNNTEISWRKEKYKTDLYAIYPASAVADYSNGDEWYFVSAFKNTNNFLLAGCNDTRVDDGYSFTFMNLVGALSFKVNASGIDGGFDSYIVSGNNNETVGYANYCVKMDIDGDTDKNDFRTLYTGSDGPGPSSGELKNILVEDWDGADGTTINTVYFPNGVNFTSGFTIKFMKSGSEVRRVSTNTSKNIAVGKYLDLGDITSHLFTYVPPATHDSSIGCPADGSDYDLSKDGSANCYIVDGSVAGYANKVFKFKANKGNSAVGVGTINSVEVLWATYNSDTAPTATTELIAEVDYDKQSENDYYEICFKMPATLKAGNAVVAAKDALDNILWSWHIWIPETTVTNAAYGGIFGSNGMDRQLGALIAASDSDSEVQDPKAFGLLYQWGRKDPFLGGYTPASGVMISSSNSFESKSSSPISLSYSIMHPTKFAYNGETAVDPTWAGENWCSDYDADFWGGASGVKAQYDPCPPGYKVPRYDGDLGLWNKTGWTFDTTNLWFKKEGAVFPYSSYLDDCDGSIKKKNNRTKVWGATAYSGVKSYIIYVDGSSLSITSAYNAAGAAVRCCVE